jgi:RNA polymerase sigma-70 factor (ECF subfamily)
VDDEGFRYLLGAAKGGHRAAIASLYRNYNPMLVHFVRAQVPDMGEDLAHETWLAVGARLREFSGNERTFRIWLLSIARTQVAEHVRSSGYIRTSPVDPSRLSGLTHRHQPEDVRVADAAIAQLLSGLPSSHAEILLLRVVGGLSAEETGALVGKSAGAVRVIQHRALRKLAKRLSKNRVAP